MRFNSLFGYFVIILFSPLIGKLIKNITIYYKAYKEFKSNNTLLELTYRLTPHEFEIWCGEYLSHIGFTNIIVSPLGPDGGKDIICNKGNEKYYVECKRYGKDKVITIDIVEKLLGTMLADNIHNGIIITTSRISDEAKLFLKGLKSPYNINVISGEDLSISYSEYILQAN